MVTSDEHVLFTSEDGKLRMVDPDGSVVWAFNLGADSVSSPAVSPTGVVIVGTDAGKLKSVGTQMVMPPEIEISNDITEEEPEATITVTTDITSLPLEPSTCADCELQVRYNVIISQAGTSFVVDQFQQELPVLGVGELAAEFPWSGPCANPDDSYHIDVQTVLGWQMFEPVVQFIPVAVLGTTVVDSVPTIAVIGCKTAVRIPFATRTSYVCELADNTDLGWPTVDRRTCGAGGCATRFIFGDTGARPSLDQDFAVSVNGVPFPLAPGGEVGRSGNDDSFATWTNAGFPWGPLGPGASCGIPLTGIGRPQTIDGFFAPGMLNSLGAGLTMGPAFSAVSSGEVAIAKMFAYYPNPDESFEPIAGNGFLLLNGPAVSCTSDADCQTPFTPDDTCEVLEGDEPNAACPAPCTHCVVGDASPPFPRWRGGQLAVSSPTIPMAWQPAGDNDVESNEVLRAFRGDPATGLGKGGPFTFPTFVVESYQGREGVWVYGRPSYGGEPGHPASNVYLMRLDFEDGKLGEPRYFVGCDGGDDPADCLTPGTHEPTLVARSLPSGDVPAKPLFNDEHFIVFNQGSIAKVPSSIGGSDVYVMLYGGRPPTIAVEDHPLRAALNLPPIPSFTSETFGSELRTGIHMRLALSPWGPWSQPQVVYNALSERTPGYCDLLYWDPRQVPETPMRSDFPLPPIPPDNFGVTQPSLFCAKRRGLDTSDVVGTIKRNHENSLLRDRGPFAGEDFKRYASHGFEYAPGIIEALTIPRDDSVVLEWTMSTWVPYRVVMMETELTLDPDAFGRVQSEYGARAFIQRASEIDLDLSFLSGLCILCPPEGS